MGADGHGSELSRDERDTLDAVLDEIIPPSDDGRLPGAGRLGLSDYVDAALRAMPAVREMVVRSLAALGEMAGRRAGRRFAALDRGDRVALLDELAAGDHAFPPVLILHAYAGYYQQPDVLAALGLEARPPHPEGYATVAGDLALLDPVRRRGRLYRDA
jgi:hypothetical protein